MPSPQKITPFLWFNDNAEEAAAFYTSIFKDSRITNTTKYGPGAPRPAGSVMTIAFELAGQHFTALNGGPHFKINEAISFVVHCDNQAEIDTYWDKLTSSGGQAVQCGWLKDRFGVSWQIVPAILPELLKNPATAGAVMQEVLKMIKIDIATLQAAAGKR